MTIDLYYMPRDVAGLILSCPSGVRYSNQMGGTACGHPTFEGVFLPLSYQFGTTDPSRDLYVNHDHDQPTNAELLRYHEQMQATVDEMGLANQLSVLSPEALRLGMFPVYGEAWIPVRVRPAPNDSRKWRDNAKLLDGFAGRIGVLTYTNSD